MNINELKESKYLTKHDVEPELTATIVGIGKENLAREGDAPEYKYILKFQECKPLLLNSTNGQLAALALGSEETNDWVGKQVTMYNDRTVSFGGKLTGGVRIRPDAVTKYVEATKDETGLAPAQPVDDMNDSIPF